jgi:hypothetical protein
MLPNKKFIQEWPKLVKRAWQDETFRQRLLKHPKEVLKEQGITLPDKTICKVQEVKENELLFMLPEKPKEEISDRELAELAGGLSMSPEAMAEQERMHELIRSGKVVPPDEPMG